MREPQNDSLKQEFCNNNKNVIWKILDHFFPRGYLDLISENNTFTNEQYIQEARDAFNLMALDLFDDPRPFCDYTGTDESFLRSLFKKKLSELRKDLKISTASFDEDFMDEKGIVTIIPDEESISDLPPPVSFSSEVLLLVRSLSDIEKTLFEIKFIKNWIGKTNIPYLLAFVLNTTRLGNQSLSKELEANQYLSIPIIKYWFEHTVERSFLSSSIDSPQDWANFYKSIKTVVDDKAVNQLRVKGQNLNRKVLRFDKRMLQMDKYEWTETERYYYILHEYLEIESRIEIWFQLCQISSHITKIEKELKHLNCWREGINFLDLKFNSREIKIIRKWKLGMKFRENLTENILSIQNSIDKKILRYLNQNIELESEEKLFKPIKWKTINEK